MKKGPGKRKSTPFRRSLPPIILRIRCDNRVFGAMVDTGAAASIVSSKFIQQIQPAIRETIATEQQFRVANGAVTCAIACHIIKLTPILAHSDVEPFIRQAVYVSFFEIPGLSYDVLLGQEEVCTKQHIFLVKIF